MRRRFCLLTLLTIAPAICWGGGPAYVAGASYFDPWTKGTPITWPEGIVSYYTDQGNLSPMLNGPAADAFVRDAFARWTSIPTAAVVANHAGQLAEDVSGANVSLSPSGVILPADTQPTATGNPVAIVYDYDGAVTDALLGRGASGAFYCAGNSVFGGIDNIAPSAQFAHAIIIVNGNCATAPSELPDLEYHLVRVIGRVLGLDWTQANLNVITQSAATTAADYAGFPVMHETDRPACKPIALCYSNGGSVDPALPKLDDQLALSRLYPVTSWNLGNFPGKQVFSGGRIRGSLYFDDGTGQPGQPMQGVNVVARWIDPATNSASRTVVSTAISGFLFAGNAGNTITGFTNTAGQNFNQFGSDDTALGGYFDLSGLPIPNGNSARYQVTVEPVDPLWSAHAGPYGSTAQVQPSGAASPITITVTPGGTVQEDLVMQGSAVRIPNWYGETSYASPVQVPSGGTWTGTLNSYAATDYFQFAAKASRSLSVMVTAKDESDNPTQNKAMPVVGIWGLANQGQTPAPVNTPSAFNTFDPGTTRLDAQLLQSTSFRLGIADYRGDGRPDYNYSARIFYADEIKPSRASVLGGTAATITGMGFESSASVLLVNSQPAVLASTPRQMLINTPSAPDGVYDVQLADSRYGATSVMSGALTIGAGPLDRLKLISGVSSAVPIGGQTSSPFTVQVVAPDGVTPVSGATVQFSSVPAVGYSACNGNSTCSVITDQSGMASSSVTLLSAVVNTLIAKLAPTSYSPPQQVQTTVIGTSSSLDLSLANWGVWVAQGATVTVPITARVLSNGSGLSGSTVAFQVTQGSATLSQTNVQTSSGGYATSNLQLTSLNSGVQVSACVSPQNNPCQGFQVYAVPSSSVRLQPVSGLLQILAPGQTFLPAIVRATDSATPAHAVIGASVLFQEIFGRLPGNEPVLWVGEAGISQPGMPVILGQSQATLITDLNGLASFPVSAGGFSGNIAIAGSATAGAVSVPFTAQQLGP